MSTLEIIYAVYLSGVVFWTTMAFLGTRGKQVRHIEIMAFLVGVFWFIFVPYNIFKIMFEKRSAGHEKIRHR